MKKIIITGLSIVALTAFLVALAGMYKFNYLASQPGYDVDGNKIDDSEIVSNPLNTTYTIDGKKVTLIDGVSETAAAPGSAAKITTRYFGNEVRTDLNNDGKEDIVFLLTQETGGSGTFFYVVAALDAENGWVGSKGYFLGDRIAPQTTNLSDNPSHQNVIVVNYADREDDQPMSEQPSVGKSVWLKLDVDSMTFGEVMQNFEGEANPDSMALDMKTWTWRQTQYNNDTELTPNQTEAFTLTLSDDGSVSATTDCNSMNGTYELDGNQITFGPMAMTRMFCPESQEQDFAKMFEEIQSYFFTSTGELVFEFKFDSGTATFR